jgi:hypothetical protein
MQLQNSTYSVGGISLTEIASEFSAPLYVVASSKHKQKETL